MARRKLIEVMAGGFRDNNGDPLNAGTVNTYEVGSTSNKTTYTTMVGLTLGLKG
jgi:hypothetical protein